jgi:hypothetical protein
VPLFARASRPGAARTPLPDRIAFWVVVASTVWFGGTALWGLCGAPGSGHLGSGTIASIAAAETILKWKIPWPSWDWYAAVAPSKASYACHHPYGTFYLPLPILWAFGHHDWVLPLPGALMATLSPPLLYGIAKARWGAPAGAVAAASYVVLPIVVGYSSFWGLETVSIFGALLFLWGHSRHMTTRKRRHLVASVLGALICCSGDWIGYVLVAVPLGWGLLRAFVLPVRLTPRFHRLPYAQWWALSASVAVGSLLLWIALFQKADHMQDWLSAGTMRSSGNALPLKLVLEGRKNWIDFSFTPMAIFLGKVAAPLCALRFLILRRDEELYAPALLLGAVVQYVAFKEGADIHFFWPLYFGPYYSLALAALVHTVAGLVRVVASRLVRVALPRARTIAAFTCLALGLAPTVAMAHDGARALVLLRQTGGRYDNNGLLIRSDVDSISVMREVLLPRKTPGMMLDHHPGFGWYWHMDWQWAGKPQEHGAPLAGRNDVATHPYWIARASGLSSDDQKKIAHDAHVRVYGDVWVVDQREPAGPLDAYSMNEREPGLGEWLLHGPQRMRTPGTTPDPWLTWEWRTHLEQDAAPPRGTPSTLEEMRIAHNAAVALADTAGAERWREAIEAKLDRSMEAKLDPGLTLVGTRLTGGVEPRLQSWFLVTAAPTADATFFVRSTMVGRGMLSLVPPDAVDRPLAYPGSLPTKLWKVGYLYFTEIELDHRIGREKYVGRWLGAWAPKRMDGTTETTLAEVP